MSERKECVQPEQHAVPVNGAAHHLCWSPRQVARAFWKVRKQQKAAGKATLSDRSMTLSCPSGTVTRAPPLKKERSYRPMPAPSWALRMNLVPGELWLDVLAFTPCDSCDDPCRHKTWLVEVAVCRGSPSHCRDPVCWALLPSAHALL